MAGSPRYRLLLVTNWISWAGAETQLRHLAIGLSENGHSVTMLATGEIISDVADLEGAGVEVVELNAIGRWAKLRALPRLARHARRADLVHCTGWDATLWGRLAALIARRPAVITEHTPGRDLQTTEAGASRTKVIALHNRFLDRTTAATIVVGEWQRKLLEEEGVEGGRIVHVPNAVPVQELSRKAKEGPTRGDLGIPEDVPLVIEVARFAPQKGQDTVVRGIARVRERLGDVRVLFVGDGETEAEVRREAASLDADWVTFLGRRHDVPGLLSLADVSVLPSTGEGLPMSLIEAIVLGTPVVGTDVGDVRWLIESTGAGICIDAVDEDAFADACVRILGEPELRRELSEAGIAARSDFDAPLMVDRYESVFVAAIESTPFRAMPEAGTGGALRVWLACDWFVKYTVGLARGLSELGCEVVLLTRDHDQEFGGEPGAMRAFVRAELGEEVRHVELPGRVSDPKAIRDAVRIARGARKWNADVVHVQDSLANDLRLAFASGLATRRYALTVHDPVPHPGDAPARTSTKVLRRRLRKRAGLLFVHSDELREELIGTGEVSAPVEVVPHGVGTVRRAPLPAEPSLLFFGRMSYYKGLDVLLDAMPELWEKHPELRLVVAGGGEVPEHPLLSDPRVESRFEHVPEDALTDLFADATCVVLPYRQASQSGVGSLAREHGRPVVATSVGGLPELITPDWGRLVAPEDPGALAAAIVEVIDTPGLAEAMSEAAASLGESSWRTVADRSIAAYRAHLL